MTVVLLSLWRVSLSTLRFRIQTSLKNHTTDANGLYMYFLSTFKEVKHSLFSKHYLKGSLNLSFLCAAERGWLKSGEGAYFNEGATEFLLIMDQISRKTPNPKCRLYWGLKECIDWRYSQSCWYFRPLLWTSTPLTGGEGGDRGPQTDKHMPPSTFTG